MLLSESPENRCSLGRELEKLAFSYSPWPSLGLPGDLHSRETPLRTW